jgi:trehalose 6-phosphate synthase
VGARDGIGAPSGPILSSIGGLAPTWSRILLVVRHVIRFLLPLLLFVGALGWGVTILVNATSRRWVESDVAVRAQLAASGAREALALNLRSGERGRIGRVLADLTREGRVMAAAACAPDGAPIASSRDYPAGLGCELVRARMRSAAAKHSESWDQMRDLPQGRVLVSGVPILEGQENLGYLLLVLDLSYSDPRESETRRFLVGALALVALAASIVTVLVARLSWRSWTDELRRLLRGKSERREFTPILRDVRELAARLAAAGRWSPQRLRETLTHQLQGEGIILVANREPYIHERAADGSVQVQRPASGLVTALEPVMRACSGVWIAHGSGSADRTVSGLRGRLRVPPGEESYTLRRVWLEEQEEKGYYQDRPRRASHDREVLTSSIGALTMRLGAPRLIRQSRRLRHRRHEVADHWRDRRQVRDHHGEERRGPARPGRRDDVSGADGRAGDPCRAGPRHARPIPGHTRNGRTG